MTGVGDEMGEEEVAVGDDELIEEDMPDTGEEEEETF